MEAGAGAGAGADPLTICPVRAFWRQLSQVPSAASNGSSSSLPQTVQCAVPLGRTAWAVRIPSSTTSSGVGPKAANGSVVAFDPPELVAAAGGGTLAGGGGGAVSSWNG